MVESGDKESEVELEIKQVEDELRRTLQSAIDQHKAGTPGISAAFATRCKVWLDALNRGEDGFEALKAFNRARRN